MTEEGWKKDETPYIIFTCPKCGRYLYIKQGRKSKTCTQCRARIISEKIKKKIIVSGMSAAVAEVKKRQNQLALRELGENPDLMAWNVYKHSEKIKKKITSSLKQPHSSQIIDQLKSLLLKQFSASAEFPEYAFFLACEHLGLKSEKIKKVKNTLLQEGFISLGKNQKSSSPYYKLNEKI